MNSSVRQDDGMKALQLDTLQEVTPSPAEVLALAKLINADVIGLAREAVVPGVHRVNLTVRIEGTVKVNKPVTTTVPMAADPWGLLALALSKLNSATVDSLVLEHEARLAAGEKVDAEAVKATATEALHRLKATTTTMRNGAVTAALEVTVLK